MCLPCKANGYSPKDTTSYACAVCGPRGHLKFDKKGAPSCTDCVHTHAACCGCSQWKLGSEEGWTKDDLKNHRLRQDRLLCRACRNRGLTTRDTALHKCEACKKDLARNAFDKQRLNDKQKKEKKGAVYTLVCEACTTKENTLIGKLTRSKKLCTCKHRQPLGHEQKCRLYPSGYVGHDQLSLEDLRFLKFRASHVKKFNIQ